MTRFAVAHNAIRHPLDAAARHRFDRKEQDLAVADGCSAQHWVSCGLVWCATAALTIWLPSIICSMSIARSGDRRRSAEVSTAHRTGLSEGP